MHRTVAVALGAWLVLSPGPARASDFWEELRTPGLRQFQRALDASEASLAAGASQAALELADAALLKLPDRARGHVVRGQALFALHRLEEAAAAFEKAFELDSEALASPAGDTAALAAALTGRLALAERIVDRVLPRLAASARRGALYALRGDVLSSLGPERLREVEASYRQALRDAPELERRAGVGLALCLDRAGETGAAASLLATLHALDKVEAEVKRWPLSSSERAARVALVLEYAGDHVAARLAWQTVADAVPGPWRTHALARLEQNTSAAPTTARSSTGRGAR